MDSEAGRSEETKICQTQITKINIPKQKNKPNIFLVLKNQNEERQNVKLSFNIRNF